MTAIAAVELLGLAAAVVALVFWTAAGGRGLRGDSVMLLGALITLTALLRIGETLGLQALPQSLDAMLPYGVVVQRLLWGFLAYSFVQGVVQRQLRESEYKHELLLASLRQRVYSKDANLVYTSANLAFSRSLGKSPHEIVGRTDLDLYPRELAEHYREADLRALQTGAPQTFAETTTADGRERVVEVNKIPIVVARGEAVGVLGIITDVTEMRHAEEALKRAEQEKAVILDSMSEPVLYQDADMRIRWANRAVAEALNMSLDEMVGRKSYEVWQQGPASPGNMAVLRALEAGRPREGQMSTADGRTWLVRAYPVHDGEHHVIGIVEVLENITQRRRAEEASAQLAAIVEASDDAIMGLTTDGVVTSWNQGAELMYGYEAEEFVGRRLDELVPPAARTELGEAISRVSRGESLQHYETACLTREGQRIEVSLTLSPIFDEQSRVKGVSAVARNVTEQARLREELRMLSLVDALTGLHNRRGFFLLSAQQLKVATRASQPLLLIFVDVDNMKQINDTLGHQEGDHALTDTADVLRRTFRESDIIGRIGGDEYAILVLDATHANREDILGRLNATLTEQNRRGDRPYELSLSCGVAAYNPQRPGTLDELLAEADALMYEHKRSKVAADPPH